jgi:hypothetical protein
MQTIDETVEASAPPKKRGRPASGKALSESDRQARRRAKLEAEGKALLPPVVVSQDVKQALAKFIEFKDMTLGDAVDRIVRDRLLRKRSGKHKSRARTKAPQQPQC